MSLFVLTNAMVGKKLEDIPEGEEREKERARGEALGQREAMCPLCKVVVKHGQSGVNAHQRKGCMGNPDSNARKNLVKMANRPLGLYSPTHGGSRGSDLKRKKAIKQLGEKPLCVRACFSVCPCIRVCFENVAPS